MDKIPVWAAVIVAVYLAISFVVGIIAAKILRGAAKGEEGYFLAGRKMPGWLSGTSVGVTSMNADVAPAYAGMAIVVGLPIAWFYMSRFGLMLMIAAILFAYRWRKLHISTAPEFYRVRFGGRGSVIVRVWTAIWSVAIGMIPWIGAGLLGLHMIFGPVFNIDGIGEQYGIDPKAITLSIVLPVLLIYVWISGYAGVLVTDLIQSLVIVVANLFIAYKVLEYFGGPTGLADAITDSMGQQSEEVLSTTPVPGHRIFGPAVVMCWFLVTTIGAGGGMATDGQRIFSCRSPRESMKAFIWSEVVLFGMLLTLTLPVLGLLPLYPDLYMADPGERERAYGMLLAEFLPVALLGLALAGLTASVMSTIDSHLNYGAQVLTNDVLRVAKPDISERRALLFGRIMTVVILVAAVIVVYQSESLIGIAITLMGLFGSTIAFNWGQWWWWRVNFPAWLTAMVGGPFIYIGLGTLLPMIPWWAEQMADGDATTRQVLDMFRAAIGMGISTVTWMSVAMLTRPEKLPVLMEFYKQARPMGAWGPVRRAIIEQEGPGALPPPKSMIKEGLGVAIVGSTWVCLGILSLSQLFVGKYMQGILMAVAAIILALVFKKLFAWYYDRLESTEAGTVE